MSIKIYHQCGHNSTWNVDSYEKEKCGDGLILSPVHQNISKIEELKEKIKRSSIFDPQFYLPNSQKRKLKTYPFFPETISTGNFSTSEFSLVALEAARQCLDFQAAQDFEKIVIPARYFEQMVPDFTEKQDIYTVHPFLKAYDEMGLGAPIYLTVPITSHMVSNKKYREMLLNWITSFIEIEGIYLIVANEGETKQISSESLIGNYFEFLFDLKNADLELILGYTNTESLLFCLIDDIAVTMGSFENTRMFSIDKFIVSEDVRRGPKPRIYIPKLFNWVQYGQAKDIKDNDPDLWEEIYRPTEYGDIAMDATIEPHFGSPSLYKHHFICMNEQIKELSLLPVEERYKLLRANIKKAMEYYKLIEDIPYDMERHGNGDHLQPWLDSINIYFRNHLKN
jgi:hypothetical protein